MREQRSAEWCMPIPPVLKQSIDEEITAFCDKKVPLKVRDRVRLVHQWRGDKVTLVEQRPLWDDTSRWVDSPIAQFRHDAKLNDWTLHWRDRNQRWHSYEDLPGARHQSRLLVEVDRDPTGIFWG